MANLKTNIIVDAKDRTKRAFNSAKNSAKSLRGQMAGVSEQMTSFREITKTARTALSAFAVVSVGTGLIRSITSIVDKTTLLTGRIRIAAESYEEQRKIQEELVKISNETRTELDANVTLYSRLVPTLKDAGKSTDEMLQFTDQLNKTLKIGGATQQETASVTRQMSQAFAKGKLDGDEFRSVMEGSVRAGDLLTESLGVTRGELRQMAEDGEITSDKVFKAFIEGAEETDRLFAKLPLTIGGSLQQVGNEVQDYISKSKGITGATQSIAQGISGIAQSLPEIISTVTHFGTVGAAIFGVKLTGALKKYTTAKIATIQKDIEHNTVLSRSTSVLAQYDGRAKKAALVALERSKAEAAAARTTLKAAIAQNKLTAGLTQTKEQSIAYTNAVRVNDTAVRKLTASQLALNSTLLKTPVAKTTTGFGKLKGATSGLLTGIGSLAKGLVGLAVFDIAVRGAEGLYNAYNTLKNASIEMAAQEKKTEAILQANHDKAVTRLRNLKGGLDLNIESFNGSVKAMNEYAAKQEEVERGQLSIEQTIDNYTQSIDRLSITMDNAFKLSEQGLPIIAEGVARSREELQKIGEGADEVRDHFVKWGNDTTVSVDGVKSGLSTLTNVSLNDFIKKAREAFDTAVDKTDELRDALDNLVLEKQERAFKKFGLTSQLELERISQSSKDAYQTLLDSGIATTEQLSKAHEQVEKDAANAAAGMVLSNNKVSTSVDGVVRSLSNVSGATTQASRGFTDFAGKAVESGNKAKVAIQEATAKYHQGMITMEELRSVVDEYGEEAKRAGEKAKAAGEKAKAAADNAIPSVNNLAGSYSNLANEADKAAQASGRARQVGTQANNTGQIERRKQDSRNNLRNADQQGVSRFDRKPARRLTSNNKFTAQQKQLFDSLDPKGQDEFINRLNKAAINNSGRQILVGEKGNPIQEFQTKILKSLVREQQKREQFENSQANRFSPVAPKPHFESGSSVSNQSTGTETKAITLNLNLGGQQVAGTFPDNAQTRSLLEQLKKAGVASR